MICSICDKEIENGQWMFIHGVSGNLKQSHSTCFQGGKDED